MAKAKKGKKVVRRGLALGQTAMETGGPQEAVGLGVDGFEVSVNGLAVRRAPDFERWSALGKVLRVSERAIQFAIGDWLLLGEERFGEEASQAIDYTDGWSERTCDVYRWLASRIAHERRRMDRLTIRHHLLVAALTPAQQEKWLKRAANDDEAEPWTVARLRREMSEDPTIPETFWVLVACEDEADQRGFMESTQAAGRSVKAVMRRKRSAS